VIFSCPLYRIKVSFQNNYHLLTSHSCPLPVILSSSAPLNSEDNPPKFTSFNIIVEPLQDNSAPSPNDGETSVGIFDLSMDDSMIKMSDTCRNMIEQASYIPKTEVQVLYTAPPTRSGCVIFK
jgi:Reeler domain.